MILITPRDTLVPISHLVLTLLVSPWSSTKLPCRVSSSLLHLFLIQFRSSLHGSVLLFAHIVLSTSKYAFVENYMLASVHILPISFANAAVEVWCQGAPIGTLERFYQNTEDHSIRFWDWKSTYPKLFGIFSFSTACLVIVQRLLCRLYEDTLIIFWWFLRL